LSAVSPKEIAASPKTGTAASTLESDRVQTLRGAACMLLVAFHVIGSDLTMGLRVADDSAFRSFANLLIHLRMPLFTFLSGFVYAYRPIKAGREWDFANKKLLRLLIPLLVVSTIYFVMQQLTPGANKKHPWSEIVDIYYLPYAHFWFLQAIMLIFAVVGALDRFGVMRRLEGYAVVLGAALLMHFFVTIHPSYFSSNQALYLFPFFILGLGANRFSGAFQRPTLKAIALTVFVITMTLHALASYHIHGEVSEQRTLLATAISLSGLLTMLYWTPPNKTLAWIGAFSFTIYLYHVFFSSALRIALGGIGISDLLLHFFLGCAAGIAGPIVVELLFRRSPLLRRLFLGQS
jgi:glucans biosynthesis protein C